MPDGEGRSAAEQILGGRSAVPILFVSGSPEVLGSSRPERDAACWRASSPSRARRSRRRYQVLAGPSAPAIILARMSKAFTSEEAPEPTSPSRDPPRLAPGEVRYVTPEGHAALRAELERIRAGEGPIHGEERARRLRCLERTLAILTVLGPERIPDGEVGFGSWVTVEEEGGERRAFRLVGPDEVDAPRGAVSAQGPLGQALLGRRVGETVEVTRPGGVREYTIVEVGRSAPAG